MSSSTSSSSERRHLPVVVAVVLALAGLEAITRLFLYPASLDFVRFETYAGRARHLASEPGRRIALIGNSATEDAVDVELIEAELRNRGLGSVHMDTFLADGSGITTWRSMVERYFWQPGLKPDLVMVTYFGARLEDGSEEDIGRLAQFFTTPADWPVLFSTDLRGFSQRAEFLLSSVWATYAARARIKDRLLALIVPGFKEFALALNEVSTRHGRQMAGPKTSLPKSYRALNRTLERARESDSRLSLVAFPMRLVEGEAPYTIDPELRRLVEAGGADLIDLRIMPELSFDDYRDPVHLRASGKEKYSRRLVEILEAKLESIPPDIS